MMNRIDRDVLRVSQIEANFDKDEAVRCLYWIRLITGAEEIPDAPEKIDGSHDAFHKVLSDGTIVCRSVTL